MPDNRGEKTARLGTITTKYKNRKCFFEEIQTWQVGINRFFMAFKNISKLLHDSIFKISTF